MNKQTAAVDHGQEGFTVETFARFWAKPDLDGARVPLAEDIVGYWPGEDEP